MNSFQKHIPNFARDPRDEPEPIVPFNSLQELLEIDHVKLMTENKLHGADFYRFSLSDNMLMAEYGEGFHWWVVGYLNGPVEDLPIWKARYKAVGLGEIPSENVRSTCGDDITLKNGTVLKRE